MHILKVRPCSEFTVRDELHMMGLIAFVPVIFSVSKFGKGKETIKRQAVIPGYIFAKSPAKDGVQPMGLIAEDWHRIRAEQKKPIRVQSRLSRITGMMSGSSGAIILTPSQEAAVMLLSRPLERANSHGWSPGDRVRVRRGAFAELDAVVSQIKRGHVIATVQMLGKTHTVKLALDQMEAA